MSNLNNNRLRDCQKLIEAFARGVVEPEELYSNMMANFISPGIAEDFETQLWEKSLSELPDGVEVAFRQWAHHKGRDKICRGIARMNSVNPEDNNIVDRRYLQIAPVLDRLTVFLANRQEKENG